MAVNWTIRARRRLRSALAEALCREGHGPDIGDETRGRIGVLDTTMDRLHDILASTFPGSSVVVQDQLFGFRKRSDLFVLLVEVFSSEPNGAKLAGPYVVKIGPPDQLERELKGWNLCRPPGLRHDLVFLTLSEGVRTDDGQWMSLVYGDAQQFLGVETTAPFEKAALDSVRFGSPSVASLGFVVVELYERIGHLLYSQAFVEDPALPGFEFNMPKLDESLQCWETDPIGQAAHRDVNTLADSGIGEFLDPVDYLRYVQGLLRAGSETPGIPGMPWPKITDLIPRMLRGCAHGDLHGRNILVGIIRDRALWPTVYDYEDMGPCNLVGWDFVKLETELKIRAYPDVFTGLAPARFVESVQRFEVALNEETEHCHLSRSWPTVDGPESAAGRLRALLLELRRMAAQHLGVDPGRPNDWLEEYYFLLTCYGVTVGRFPNLAMRERIGALLAAGVATARLTWPRSLWPLLIL